MEKTRKTILLVDDNDQLISFLSKELGSLGFQCELCGNGRDAFQKYKQSKFDLILSDIEMPIETGISLLQNIRKQDMTTPVMLMSGGDFSPEFIGALGAQGFFAKPFIFSTLIKTIANYLNDR